MTRVLNSPYGLPPFAWLLLPLLVVEATSAPRVELVLTPPNLDRGLKGGADSVVRALVVKGTSLPLDSSFFTLDSVQHVLGKTILVEPRDEHGDWSICYSATDSIGSFTMRFQSDEMGGSDHDVLGFELTREKGFGPDRCTRLGRLYDVKTDNGLYLGMPLPALFRVMGHPVPRDRFPPVRTEGVQYWFRFHKTVTAPIAGRAQTYNVDAWLAVQAASGRVIGLFAWHGETM